MFVKLYKTRILADKKADGLGSNIIAVPTGYSINSTKIYCLGEFEHVYNGKSYYQITFDLSSIYDSGYRYELYLIDADSYKALTEGK